MSPQGLSESLEDYLEAIYHIVAKKQAARAKDISDRMHVNRSSVTGALRSLAQKGLVNYAPYDVITLTDSGQVIAKDVVHRHEVLHDFFVRILGAEESIADQAACGMEHAMPKDILERFVKFVRFADMFPGGRANWVMAFQYYCRHGEMPQQCKECFSSALPDKRREPSRA